MGTYSLDGLALDDPAGRWRLERSTGIRIIPGRVNAEAELPGRDGVVPVFGSGYEAGAVGLSLVITGADHGAMMGVFEFLAGVLAQRSRLLPLVHDYGNGQTRTAMVQVVGSSAPELVAHRDALLEVVFSVPGVFWRDAATVDSSVSLPASSGTSVLTGLAGSTGPVSDALVQVAGGFSSATLTGPVTGDKIVINRAVAAGQYVVIDCANWRARLHSSNSWSTTGGTDILSDVTSSRGMGPMLSLAPDFTTGAGRVRLTTVGTGLSGTPGVVVRAARSFI